MFFRFGFVAFFSLFAIAQQASGGSLVINANTSDPAPKAAFIGIVNQFQAEHPDIKVEFNIYDHESYKKSIRNWLTAQSPDIVFWFAGYRMQQFVDAGLLEDISELFGSEIRSSLTPGAINLVTVNGKQYGVPYAYYNIGFYYRRDLLAKAGLSEFPDTFEGLLDACRKLNEGGVEPVALGSKDLWPTAAWFDYIDLRVNGFDFHSALMAGKIPYTDDRVRAIFTAWKKLLDAHCFISSHASLSWQESQITMYQGKAAMMLIGNFIVPNFPPEIRDSMEFAPFPVIKPDVGRYEEAPMNSLHIPANASHKPEAKKFLQFVLQAPVQEKLAAAMRLIPASSEAKVADDRFLKKGQALLLSADRLSQYFDRDTNEELATIAMKQFQLFLAKPDQLDEVLATIESARKRIYP